MNVTEMFEEVLALARLGQTIAAPERSARAEKALARFQPRVHKMRFYLDRLRRDRSTAKRAEESCSHLMLELIKLPWPCTACHYSWGEGNPLRTCTGEFGCSMDCLRYKASEIHPNLL